MSAATLERIAAEFNAKITVCILAADDKVKVTIYVAVVSF